MNRNREQILHLLKTRGRLSTGELSRALSLSTVGTRSHLLKLEESGLVFQQREESGPSPTAGRPSQCWQLTTEALGHFPNRHQDFSVEIIEGVREVFGDEGLRQLLDDRSRQVLKRYQDSLAGISSLQDKLEVLATLRSADGYMAEVDYDASEKAWRFTEHHCPVHAVARCCQALCRTELELFQDALDADVEPGEHLLQGAQRCVWLIRPRSRHNQLSLI